MVTFLSTLGISVHVFSIERKSKLVKTHPEAVLVFINNFVTMSKAEILQW